MSAAELRTFLRTGRADRPPLVSTLFYHAARLAGADMGELLADPARLTRALLDMHRLVPGDVVAVKLEAPFFAAAGLDPATGAGIGRSAFDGLGIVPEVGGIVQDAAPLLEVITRLAAELKRQVPVLAVLPGPLTVGGDAPEAAAAALRTLVEQCCKAGAGMVLIDESVAPVTPDPFTKLVAPMVNTARYFSAPVIVACDQRLPKSAADAVLLPATGVLAEKSLADRTGVTLGQALLISEGEELAGLVQRAGPCFLGIDDAAVAQLPVESLVAAFGRLRILSFR